MFRTLFAASTAAALLVGFANASQEQTLLMQDDVAITRAQDAQDTQDNDRLSIAKDHHVIYDDHRNDPFCRVARGRSRLDLLWAADLSGNHELPLSAFAYPASLPT